MNCSTALRQFSAERDAALPADQRAQLETHLASCSGCRQARTAIALSIADWRALTLQVNPPDAERAWQEIRSQAQKEVPSRKSKTAVRGFGWGLPVGAAIALGLTAAFIPHGQIQPRASTKVHRLTASADFVEVPNNASSIVYVDDQSGWLVVWSDAPSTGG